MSFSVSNVTKKERKFRPQDQKFTQSQQSFNQSVAKPKTSSSQTIMTCNIVPSNEAVLESASMDQKKQRVTFPESEEELVAVRHFSLAEELLWMDESEFQAVRAQAHLVSDLNRDKEFARLLCPIENPEIAQAKLDLWAKMENDRNMRGLERYVCSEHRNYRDTHSAKAVQAVLEAQQQAKENGLRVELDSIYRQYSTSCAEFAQMIAKADEKAVHQRSRCRSTSPMMVSRSRRLRSVTE